MQTATDGEGANGSNGNANSGNHSRGEVGSGGNDDDEEDNTVELLRELKKKQSASEQQIKHVLDKRKLRPPRLSERHELQLPILCKILPLLPVINTTAPGTFAVKRCWDDGPTPFF